jgi:hypothetical protein
MFVWDEKSLNKEQCLWIAFSHLQNAYILLHFTVLWGWPNILFLCSFDKLEEYVIKKDTFEVGYISFLKSTFFTSI